MRVLWLTNIPSPYRVDFFNELGKQCRLTVLFEKKVAADRDKSWADFYTEHFTPVFLGGIKNGAASAFCPGVLKHLSKKKYDIIVVTNYASLTGILAIAMLKMRNIPYIIEGDGAFAGTGFGLKEKIKRWLLSGAEACFSTAAAHDEYYCMYGVSEEKIIRYPFTSLRDSDILSEPVTLEKKENLRQKLGMKEKRIILAVGQFIPRKGYDILIEAMAKLPKDVGCYIVGGNPPKAYLEQKKALGVDNIHFAGFKGKAVLAEYYMAADVFAHPTREDIWGLVVNEAMAKGLPVVTTERCVAGLELITEPDNGVIVPVNAPEELAEALSYVLNSTDMAASNKILEKIREYSIEKMASTHIAFWN